MEKKFNIADVQMREASLNDLETLLHFEQGIVAAERPLDSTLKEGEIHYYDLAQMIYEPHIALMVAEYDGKLIASGYARIESAKPYLKFEKLAYVGFMYVVPEYRGLGVNKLVIESLRAWARSKGMVEMRLDVYATNTAAINAYERAGFVPNLLNMRLPV